MELQRVGHNLVTEHTYIWYMYIHCMYVCVCICIYRHRYSAWGFPGGSVVKNLPANAGDTSSISGSGRSPGGGNGNPFQSSCLENPVDRGAWWPTVHGVTKSGTLLSNWALRLTVLVERKVFSFLLLNCYSLRMTRYSGRHWEQVRPSKVLMWT